MLKYLRLFALFVKSSILMELEYRANFIAQGTLGTLYAGISVVTVLLVFSQTDRLGGWSLDQGLVVVGIFIAFDGLTESFIQPNIRKLIDGIRTGTFDFTLLKPVDSQFMTMFRYMRLNGLMDFAAGVVVIVIALSRLGLPVSALQVLTFLVTLVMAALIIYALQLMLATSAFWFVKVDNFTEAFRALYDTARYPVSAFRGLTRLTLTVIVPIAFMTTVPAQALLGMLDGALLAGSLAFGLGLTALSVALWRRALRSYSSASS